jgi:AraC-like DNA-binding protein
MEYEELIPRGSVAKLIKCYWMIRDESPTMDIQRIVPDGRSELILRLGSSFEDQKDGGWKKQPEYFFAGQITRPFLLRPTGPIRMLGIRFQPHGASEVLRTPVHGLTDSVIALDDISCRLHRQLARLRDLPSLHEGIVELDRIMHESLQDCTEGDLSVAAAVSEFEVTGGRASVSAVADHVGLSPRQLERRFLDAVGIPPKLFCRMQRFQRVFQLMERPNLNWMDAAVRCGYYDQAHLIRDFREFSGKTPTALVAREVDLSRQFSGDRSMSRFSKTLAGDAL